MSDCHQKIQGPSSRVVHHQRCHIHNVPLVHRKSKFGQFLGCPEWPGCDIMATWCQDGKKWCVSDQRTRTARVEAHKSFDRLWKGPDKVMNRREAYRWLQWILKLEPEAAHIRQFNVMQCEAVTEAVWEHLQGQESNK